MNGAGVIAELRRNHEGWIADCSASLRWPFAIEYEQFFHRRLHAARLRELFAAADRAASRDALALAARGRLRRILGDDAGAGADLRAALERRPRLAVARAWLAEIDLAGPDAERGLGQALEGAQPPVEALFYRAVSRLLRGDARGAERDARAARRDRPAACLSVLIHGTALERCGRRTGAIAAYGSAGRLRPNSSVGFILRARLETSARRREAALEDALCADPCYALITMAWFKPGVSWETHAKRLVAFAFSHPDLVGWYQRQSMFPHATYQFRSTSKNIHERRPGSAWAAALVARDILRCPPDPALTAAGLRLAESAVRAKPNSGWMRSWRALGLLKAGRHDEAVAEFTRGLKLQPYYHRALAWRGALRGSLGRQDEALTDLDTACGIDEFYPFSAHARSLARRRTGDWIGAALELDRAYGLNFHYAWVYTTLREPTRAEFARATRELARAAAAHPSCASLRAWRGDTLRRAGDLSAAVLELRAAAALDPAHANALGFLGRALLDAGRPEEALGPLLRAVQLAPAQRIFDGWRAQALFRVGRRAESFRLLAKIMKEVPPIQMWWPLHMRAELLMECGRARGAVRDLEAAVRVEARHADVYFLCARARLDCGDVRGAAEEVGKALVISPNLGRAYLLRAEIRRRLGKPLDALADYRVVRERFTYLFNEEERAAVDALLKA